MIPSHEEQRPSVLSQSSNVGVINAEQADDEPNYPRQEPGLAAVNNLPMEEPQWVEIQPEEPIQIELIDPEEEEMQRLLNIFKFQHKCSGFIRVALGSIILFNIMQNISGWT